MHSNENTTTLYAYTIESVFRCISLCFNKICIILLGIELLSSTRTLGATLYHASHTGFHISSFLHDIWLPFSSLYSKRSLVFMSRRFPSHSRTGSPLHSWNVLVLLGLWHGVISCIKIYPFCDNTMHSHNISISWIISL